MPDPEKEAINAAIDAEIEKELVSHQIIFDQIALMRAFETGEDLPEPYRSLMDRKFWDELPSDEKLRDYGFSSRISDIWSMMNDDPKVYAEHLRKSVGSTMSMFMMRERFAYLFSFAIPSRETLETIAQHSRSIVEVGAGNGFWAHMLSKVGVDVVATDIEARSPENGAFVEVQPLDGISAVRAFPDRDLFSCWPHMDAYWLTEALSHLRPGRLFFYIGENGGCTGHASTHSVLRDGAIFTEVGGHYMTQFQGINDNLTIYRRTSEPWRASTKRSRTSTSRRQRMADHRRSSGKTETATGDPSSASGEGSTSDT